MFFSAQNQFLNHNRHIKCLFCITGHVNSMRKGPTVVLESFSKNQLPWDVTQEKLILYISILWLSGK